MVSWPVIPALTLLLLAACSEPRQPAEANAANAAAPEPVPEDRIVLRGDGLLVETAGGAAPLTFGTSTVSEAEYALGPFGPDKASESSEECPTGKLDYRDYPNGLQLAFQEDKLVGWWAFEKATDVATAGGIKPGSPRSAIGKTKVQQASFGNVFTVDEVNGLLDEGGATKVGAMWAGAACIFD